MSQTIHIKFNQKGNAESLPQRRSHRLVIYYQMVSPDNLYIQETLCKPKGSYLCIKLYINMYIYILT